MTTLRLHDSVLATDAEADSENDAGDGLGYNLDVNETPPTEPQRDARVYFAAERTMLAWIRTGIAMMGFGFVVARFGLFLRELAAAGTAAAPHRPALSLWVGTSLVVLGVWVNLAAAIRHFRFRRRFERGEPFITPKGLMIIILSALLGVVGIAMTLYLIVIGHP
jgi:putative membrane protein